MLRKLGIDKEEEYKEMFLEKNGSCLNWEDGGSMKKYLKKEYILRVVVVVVSIFMAGLGLAFLRLSCLGTDPFSALCYQMSEILGLPLVVFMLSLHLILFLTMISGMKQYIGIGMLVNMVLYGMAADFWKPVIQSVLHVPDEYDGFINMPARIGMMLAGLFILVFFIAFYMASDTGMSPYDAFAYELERRFPILPFKGWRVIQDGSFFVLAFVVGLMRGNPWTVIGIATIVMVFFIGPVISFFRRIAADPFFALPVFHESSGSN